jgi:rSAM/selenodomain-associated transferase 1
MIVIFARVPESGRTKTRLIPALGPADAARLAAAMTGDVLELVASTGLPYRVALAGNVKHPWVTTLGAEWEPQAEGTLGEKLAYALRDGGVAIGTDAPTVPAAMLREAHASTADVVLAPAFDGGYVLVGVQDSTSIFEGVPWSAPNTYAAQHARAVALGRSIRVLPFWYDVDEPSDLTFLARHLQTLPERVAPRTRVLVEAWVSSGRIALRAGGD